MKLFLNALSFALVAASLLGGAHGAAAAAEQREVATALDESTTSSANDAVATLERNLQGGPPRRSCEVVVRRPKRVMKEVCYRVLL